MKYYCDPEHDLTDEEKVEMYPTAKFAIDQLREYIKRGEKGKWKKNITVIDCVRAWDKGQQDIRNRRIEREIEKGDQNRLEDYSGA